ncbi:MAG: O-antigen ligase family protein, partial [Acidimicrobiales bacterium]|nr:O-antigen ligase family protein [Acidimicrobiales bacterium]
GWYILHGIVPGAHRRGASPLRFALGARLATVLLSLGFGLQRALIDGESLAADRFLLATLATMGVALIAADGISSRERLDDLGKRMTYGAAFVALVAFFQFIVNVDLTRAMELPGLDFNAAQYAIQTRGDFNRVAGTASHAIEFAVVIGMMLPIAAHYAIHARTRNEAQFRWAILALIATGVPFSVSRAGIVAFGIAMITLAMVWDGRRKLNALVAMFLGVCVMFATVPGLFGTIKNLFLFAGQDTSISARTEDYSVVGAMIAERPWFGRGAGTWIVEGSTQAGLSGTQQYFTLDNEILGTTVQTGYVGLTAVLILYITGFALARDARHRAQDYETKHLAQALAAITTVSLATTVTFDSFGFPMHSGLVYLGFGVSAALWRLERDKQRARDIGPVAVPDTREPAGLS